MSPNVSSFVGDLVEMAKAFEALPQVQSELADARSTIDAQAATIQRLELKLMQRGAEIVDAQAKLRKVEAERDDAELRFLERDDALGVIRRALEGVAGVVHETIKASEPPVPAMIPTSETASIPDPLPVGATTSDTPTSETPSPSEGQSEEGPTEAPAASTTIGAESGTSDTDVGVSVSSGPTASSSPGDESPTVGGDVSANANGPGLSPTDVPTDPAADPEPSPWTPEWYDWMARRDQAAQ